MSRFIFSERAWSEYLYWQTQDKKTLKRINKLLRDIERNSNDGIGKPEILKHRKGFSKRIDDCNRLVYNIQENLIEIIQCKGHYDD